MLEGSNIPGQTPIDDLSGLRLKGVRTLVQLNAAEAENIRAAMLKYFAATPTPRLAPFDAPWLRQLHREMFGDVWVWAGALRKRETNLGSHPSRTEHDLHELLEDLRAWEQSSLPLIEQTARLHHRAVLIHPFPNGNGRWSRTLANIWQALRGGGIVVWPESTIGAASIIRQDYLAAVRAADRGDYGPLIAMHVAYTHTPDAP